ncbi:hypothetical protein jhhlp_002808 [Lomentospora prolificans]|uniref:Uncharacterized protein n=1 Tax=Lomentospora prolificans TaxID=41688 RepID=A0A2N3NF78_9PEZI|nr:hypothetical protein jhhlp_002808 [Lomentospora prolificans]
MEDLLDLEPQAEPGIMGLWEADWEGQPPILHSTPRPFMPHFAYLEKFEGGSEYRGISAGRGKFIPIKEILHSPHISFVVEKDRIRKTLGINIQSDVLMTTIFNALATYAQDPEYLPSDFDTLMKYYDALRLHLEALETQFPAQAATLEFRLLVEDLLLDRAIFDGIGMEQFRQRGVLCQTHLRDIHERSIDAGLDEIDDCFALGLMPAYISEDYLSALNEKYTELALSGDFVGLYNLCEPIVRSGDIELQHNPSLLLKILEQGRFDIYWYLLDLVTRTSDRRQIIPGTDLPDVTLDPLHVAIRVGHLKTVQTILGDQITFKGHISDDSAIGVGHHVFTPLSAAVYWRQPEVTQYILGFGQYDRSELETAVTIALANDDFEQMNILLDSGALTMLSASSPPRPENPSGIDSGDSSASMEIPMPAASFERIMSDATDNLELEPLQPFDWNWDVTITPATLGKVPGAPAAAARSTNAADRPRRKEQERNSFKLSSHKRRSAQMQRQMLGKNLITYLDCLCRRVRDTLAGYDEESLESKLALHFSSFARVWDGGLAVFRQIINNHPPRGIIEVMDCLVVASALCTSICNDDSAMYLQFVNDLGRWKTILAPDEKILFNTIAFSLWAYTDLEEPVHERSDRENLARFQELIQDLVTLERNYHRAPGRSAPYATRLSTIQKQYMATEGLSSGQIPMSIPIPGGNMMQRRRMADAAESTPESGDDFSIDQFFDVDRFLAESMDSESVPGKFPDPGLYDILSITVLLVASVAFSVVLTLMTMLQLGFDCKEVHQVWRQGPGYARSCDLLSLYFDGIGGYSKTAQTTRLCKPFSLDRRIENLSLSAVSVSSTGYTGSPASSISHTPVTSQTRASSSTNLQYV